MARLYGRYVSNSRFRAELTHVLATTNAKTTTTRWWMDSRTITCTNMTRRPNSRTAEWILHNTHCHYRAAGSAEVCITTISVYLFLDIYIERWEMRAHISERMVNFIMSSSWRLFSFKSSTYGTAKWHV